MPTGTSATAAQYTPTQGLLLGVSSASSTNPSDTTLTFVDLTVTINQVQNQGASTTKLDVTTFASAAKEYALGLSDSGTFPMQGNMKIGDAAQQALTAAYTDKKPRVFKVTFPDTSEFLCVGLVDQLSWTAKVDGVATVNFNVQVTGAVTFIQPAA